MRAFIGLTALLVAGLAAAEPLPPINSGADVNTDWQERRSQPGVFYANGFDSHSETITGAEIRGISRKSFELLDDGLQPVPNNRQPDGSYYPAFDSSQAVSGGGALRLTANSVSSADHGGGWYFGSAPNNCTGGCERWAVTPGEQQTLTFSYWVRENALMNNYNWDLTGGERLKYSIVWRDGGSCSDMEVTLQAEKSPPKILNMYTNCAQNLTRYGIVGQQCNNCSNTFAYPFFGPPLGSGSNATYWSQHSPSGPPNGHKYASSYANDGAYDYDPATAFAPDEWIWFYVEVDVGVRRTSNCRAWDDPECSHLKAWLAKDGKVKQFIDYQWPWAINQSGQRLQNILLTVYQTGKDVGSNPSGQYRWYDELILSTQPQHVPANLTVSGGGATADAPPAPPTQLRISQ